MDWARMLAYVTGTVNQELLARNEYLAAENRIMKTQLKGRLKLSDAKRDALGEIGHRLGRKVLGDVASCSPTEHYPGRERLGGLLRYDHRQAALCASDGSVFWLYYGIRHPFECRTRRERRKSCMGRPWLPRNPAEC